MPVMNLKRILDWHCLAEHIGSSLECALILDAKKKEIHPSEKPFARALSRWLEITPCIPSREEAQTSSSQYTQTPNVRTILLSQLNPVFFHPSQWNCFFLPFGKTPNTTQSSNFHQTMIYLFSLHPEKCRWSNDCLEHGCSLSMQPWLHHCPGAGPTVTVWFWVEEHTFTWKVEGRGTLISFIYWAGRLSSVRRWLCGARTRIQGLE